MLRFICLTCCTCRVVFDDMYQAVVYGIEEQLTGDVRDAVIRFWHTTVEPFFGRQQRPYTQLHTKTELQQLEAEEHAGKASSSSDQVRTRMCMISFVRAVVAAAMVLYDPLWLRNYVSCVVVAADLAAGSAAAAEGVHGLHAGCCAVG